jgi:hypothetical protein
VRDFEDRASKIQAANAAEETLIQYEAGSFRFAAVAGFNGRGATVN